MFHFAQWGCACACVKELDTPGPNRDQPLRNEPQQPMINSNKWMVVHLNWPKLKSYDKGFFDWIKITDFDKVIHCFLGVISA